MGVDFGALGMVLLALIALYLMATFFSWVAWYTMAGVSQRTVYRLRREVDEKLGRLPLKYFDTHPHGDTLSRVTNDIDNIANTLQQSLTQIITSLATIVGVLAMMFWISPLLAAISLLVLPTAAMATMLIARRSQKQFAIQWDRTGTSSPATSRNPTPATASSRSSATRKTPYASSTKRTAGLRGQLQGPVHLRHRSCRR